MEGLIPRLKNILKQFYKLILFCCLRQKVETEKNSFALSLLFFGKSQGSAFTYLDKMTPILTIENH